MTKFRIELRGERKAKRIINKSINKFFNTSEEGIEKATEFLKGEIQDSVQGKRAETKSVDSGEFLESIQAEKNIVLSDVEHSKFLEFGTSKIMPRSHFRNSAVRNKDKIIKIIREEVKVK